MLIPKSSRNFLLFALALSLMVLGSILLARYQRRDGKGVYDSAVDLSQRKYGSSSSNPSDSHYYDVEERKVELFRFDPNEATKDQFLRLGLAPFQVRSILRYRAKGGCYSSPEDFKRVFRLTNQQWQRLAPYIYIGEKYRLVNPDGFAISSRGSKSASGSKVPEVSESSKVSGHTLSHNDSIRAAYPKKLTGNQTININTADSATLCRVPGIGGYYARQIISYRNRLGGFVSERQLLEIKDFPADALSWMEVEGSSGSNGYSLEAHQASQSSGSNSSSVFRKIDVNHLGERKMSRHPYMGFYRANEIVSYRKVHGPLKSIENLKGLPHFSESDIKRLEPYLEFK